MESITNTHESQVVMGNNNDIVDSIIWNTVQKIKTRIPDECTIVENPTSHESRIVVKNRDIDICHIRVEVSQTKEDIHCIVCASESNQVGTVIGRCSDSNGSDIKWVNVNQWWNDVVPTWMESKMEHEITAKSKERQSKKSKEVMDSWKSTIPENKSIVEIKENTGSVNGEIVKVAITSENPKRNMSIIGSSDEGVDVSIGTSNVVEDNRIVDVKDVIWITGRREIIDKVIREIISKE